MWGHLNDSGHKSAEKAMVEVKGISEAQMIPDTRFSLRLQE
jgi:hypothetical protein